MNLKFVVLVTVFFVVTTPAVLGEELHFAYIVDPPTETCPITNINPTPSPSEPRQYECDGIIYTVSVPLGCEKGGCGLIIDQHGALMSAENQNDGTHMREFGWYLKKEEPKHLTL